MVRQADKVAGVLTLCNQYAIFNAMKHSPSDRRKAAGRRIAQNTRGMRVGRAAIVTEIWYNMSRCVMEA